MKREPLTDRQAEVLGYIKKYIQRFKVPPTFRAIAERFDMQVNGAAGHIRLLELKGYLKRLRGKDGKRMARGLVVVD